VAAGGSGGDFAVVRLNPDGSLDTSFSGDGKQTTDFGGDDDAAELAIQADGRIVLAGTALRPYGYGGFFLLGEFALARFHADGSLDQSFGDAGKQIAPENGGHEYATGMALQADGKIVVVGWQYDTGYPENGTWFALARYRADGSLDTPFGWRYTSFLGDVAFGAQALAQAVAIQADGKIVAAGSAAASSIQGGFALARYEGEPVSVNAAPTARFAFSCTGLTCYFDGHGSTDPDGAIAGYRWNFGDGSNASGAYVRKAFTQYGTYDVRLTVTDSAGATGSRAETVSLMRLTVRSYRVGAFPTVELSWNATPGTAYAVLRGSKRVATVLAAPATDRPPGPGNYMYTVCQAFGPICTTAETVRIK
jgi:uncharacterized delta-60 repeat protein